MEHKRKHQATVPKPVAAAGFEGIARNWDGALGCWAARILPGEFYISSQEEAITTVLGSCISACIRDPRTGVGGMNHFMLPEDTTNGKSSWLDGPTGLATRYGSFAMESLINGILKQGARRAQLEIKLFGGGRVMQIATDVGARNIEFAREWLTTEGFTVAAEDVGSNVTRRVIYMPRDGKVKVKHMRAEDCTDIANRERQYLTNVTVKPAESDIELF